ncbi:hypothetical protein HZC07_04870 [Candidatus Micrarchaeota archaeon]|nr:hypothetical protein [Candidatus Micrarchaeota archaeon]
MVGIESSRSIEFLKPNKTKILVFIIATIILVPIIYIGNISWTWSDIPTPEKPAELIFIDQNFGGGMEFFYILTYGVYLTSWLPIFPILLITKSTFPVQSGIINSV